VILTVVGLALRVWRLGEWSFEGDEIFTLRDSLHPRFTNPRPLIYFLNDYLVSPVVPLDELGLRILPALFGVLAIPALYVMARRLVGTRAALFATLLLTFNAYQVYQSQYARYWSLVFLLSAVYPFLIYLGFRDRDRRALILGVIAGVLAVLAHPTSILLVGGLGLFLLTQLSRERWTQLWSQGRVRWAALVMATIVALFTIRSGFVLYRWIMYRPRSPDIKDRLLHSPSGLGIKQISIVLTYVDALTVPIVLAAAVGVYLLWRSRDRQLAVLLGCLFLFPFGFLLLLSLRTAVGTVYLQPIAPIAFIAAGVFLDRLADLNGELRPRGLIAATVTAMMLAAGAPTLISQYRDGRRNDFRAAAHWLSQQLMPGDALFSDQFRVMTHYLPGIQVQRLVADPVPLEQTRQILQAGRSGVLWIVTPVSAPGGHRTNPRIGSLEQWLHDNCQLRNSVGVARLDFRQNELQIYRCLARTETVRPVIDTLSRTPQPKTHGRQPARR
jgi:hypothetical protein